MPRIILLALTLICLVACAGPAAPTAPPTALPTVTPATDDVFEVFAWVDKPTPARDERVTISGSLVKNGVYLGGIMMRADWPREGQERGVPNCFVQMIYQRGVCVAEASDYPSGVYVPVTVTIEYRGVIYTAETGFTPQ